jgi:tetratricopeptide (TPR) repeat protein
MEHYIGLARTLGPRVGYEGGAEAVIRLAADLASIEAMIRLGLVVSDPSEATEAAIELRNFWMFSGLGTSSLLEEAGEFARNRKDFQALANCILSLGNIALAGADHDAARTQYEVALPLYRQVGAVLGEANCIQSLGDIALARSDHDAARARYEEALPLCRQVGDLLGEANCIQSLGNIALARSDHDAAQKQLERALKIYERIQESYSIGCTHLRLASIARNDAECQAHIATARKAWVSINRPDLVKELDAEFPPPP